MTLAGLAIRKYQIEAIRLAAQTEAMINDPVYEEKHKQGMIDLAKKGFFHKKSKALYNCLAAHLP